MIQGRRTPRWIALIAMLVALSSTARLIGAEPVAAADPTATQIAQLQAQLDNVRGELAAIKGQQQQDWLTQRQAEEVKTLIRDVLSDADTRASLLQEGMTAGHDGKNFFLASTDGNFRLNLRGQIQFRYEYNRREQDGSINEADREGFEMSRIRLGFSGNVVDPSWTYQLLLYANSSGTTSFLDAYVTKTFDNGLSMTAGQFKIPLLREWLISETAQQFIERSTVNNVFGGSYTQGVALGYNLEQFRFLASFNDGASMINTPFGGEDTEYAFSGRVDFLAFGDWKQTSDFESWVGTDPMLVLGASAHYQKGDQITGGDETDVTRWSLDGLLKLGGVNLFAAVVGSHNRPDVAVETDQLGVVAQAGVFVTKQVEIIGRYEWGDLDTEGVDDLSLATVGVNYFIAKHQLKVSADIGYSFNELSTGWTYNGGGSLTDAADEDGQIIGRAQIQLLF
jgi:hypothetical protein